MSLNRPGINFILNGLFRETIFRRLAFLKIYYIPLVSDVH